MRRHSQLEGIQQGQEEYRSGSKHLSEGFDRLTEVFWRPALRPAGWRALRFERAGQSPPGWLWPRTPSRLRHLLCPGEGFGGQQDYSSHSHLCQWNVSLLVQCVIPFCFPDLHGHLEDRDQINRTHSVCLQVTSFLLLLISSSVFPLFLNWAARDAAAAAFSLSLILKQLLA